MKKCSGCKLEKEDGDFSTDRSKPTGLASRCKECMNDRYRLSRLNGTYKKPPPKPKVPRKRGLVAGVGINDADYVTSITETRKNELGVYVKKTIWQCPYFSRWCSMLHRAYTHIDRPTYEGCSVSDEWVRFSNFKQWMEIQDWDGLELDKDLLVEGNKVYSAQTCVFIPQYLNVPISVGRRNSKHGPGIYIIGKKFVAKMTVEGSSLEIGRFKTKEEAVIAYRQAKAEALEKILVRYKARKFLQSCC